MRLIADLSLKEEMKDNREFPSRSYLSAETFEDWLEMKHGIGMEEYKTMPPETQSYYREEYTSDMDFRNFTCFTSDEWAGQPSEGQNKEHKGSGVLALCAVLMAAGLAIALVRFLFPTYQKTETIQTSFEGNLPASDLVIEDTVTFKNLEPGQEYSVTGTLMNKETGAPVKDKNGKDVSATQTFVPDEPSGTITVTAHYSLDGETEQKIYSYQRKMPEEERTGKNLSDIFMEFIKKRMRS